MPAITAPIQNCPKCGGHQTLKQEWEMGRVCGFKAKVPFWQCSKCGHRVDLPKKL